MRIGSAAVSLAVLFIAGAGSGWASTPGEDGGSACPVPAAAARGSDPASWTMKATFVVHVAFARCGLSGICNGGAYGYTCANGKKYCCPTSVTGDPPASSIWQATATNPDACEEQVEEEFPFPGILVTPGVGPDPERGTVLGTAPSRF